MRTYSASEAKIRFGELLDQSQHAPVRVKRYGRVVGVMVSAEDYEAMQTFYAARLLETMEEAADAAECAGLTPEKLNDLLASKN
jgi:prevent-host-death family protein